MVGEGGGDERVKVRPCAPTRKTEEAVDRRQNNGSVKAVFPRHCHTVYYAIAVSTAVLGRVTRTMSVAPLLSNNLKQKRSTFHSPASPPCS